MGTWSGSAVMNVQRKDHDFLSEPPQATVDAWLGTPYTRCIEQYVRKTLKAELIREHGEETAKLTHALEEESRRRAEAEVRVAELEALLTELEQQKGDLKLKVLKTAGNGATAGLLSSANLAKAAAFRAWSVFAFQNAIHVARTFRPDVNTMNAELETIREQGRQALVQQWDAMHEQVNTLTARHLNPVVPWKTKQNSHAGQAAQVDEAIELA